MTHVRAVPARSIRNAVEGSTACGRRRLPPVLWGGQLTPAQMEFNFCEILAGGRGTVCRAAGAVSDASGTGGKSAVEAALDSGGSICRRRDAHSRRNGFYRGEGHTVSYRPWRAGKRDEDYRFPEEKAQALRGISV